MASKTIVLVTGSKAGIGKGLLSTYAHRPNTVAIAAIRDGPDSTAAKELQLISTGKGSKIVVAKYDAGSTTAAIELVQYLQSQHGIDHFDVVIANAGILKHCGPTKDVKAEELQEHFSINTLAPILLYQATADFLNAAIVEPKFFIISSTLGSNALMDDLPLPMVAYGISKAGVNYAAGKIHREESRIVVVPVQPGWVQTAMGEKAAALVGLEAKDVPVTLADSVSGLVSVFDSATKAETSGKFWNQKGEPMPW